MENSQIRTRFAPSPTGYMHIGNLRTALYEYLIAKKNNGKFIFRLEDTDRERYIEESIQVIFNTLKITGLNHDEGPDVGGDYGPYIQSERKDIYLEYGKQLVELGGAYYCFCSKERLNKLKESNQLAKYDGYCKNYPKKEIEKKLNNGEEYVIRQKMPKDGQTSFDDVVFGNITIDNSELEDQVLIKSDGLPTYNFANVIDDHLMKITHVVRGSEYLTSTPKYNLLYTSFGWDIPVYIHLPLILNDKHEKMSKRNGDPSFEDLLKEGYLVEAIINYIALLGWSPGNNKEVFTLKELENEFSVEHIGKAPSIFDKNKLKWFNAEYIRGLDDNKLLELSRQFLEKSIKSDKIDLLKVIKILKQRLEVLSSIPELVDFFDQLPEYSVDIYTHKKMKTNSENSCINLEFALKKLQDVNEWNEKNIHDNLMELVSELGIKNGQMLWPVRTAITGKPVSPGGAIEVAEILGKDETLKRIQIGIEKLKNI